MILNLYEHLFGSAVRNKSKQVIKKVVDPTYLACDHHLYMTVGVNLVAHRQPNLKEVVEIAVIGLGGGGLCTYVHETLKYVKIRFNFKNNIK